ncbi:MAG: hypothetical protein SFZ03_07155 [Candidatus Melainabacteria bacterium]|nr:hypothetical protein [Candidatus Melainabacteria bacterium]
MVTTSSYLSPRDLSSLFELKNRGFCLLEVKVSPVSSVRGRLIDSLAMPKNTRIICVVRQGRPILRLDSLFLMEGDTLYVLTDNEETVRHFFMF